MQAVGADDLAGGVVPSGDRRLDPDPVRLLQDRGVGPMGLFRVTRSAAVVSSTTTMEWSLLEPAGTALPNIQRTQRVGVTASVI